jgi:hypothetical protein
MTHLSYVATQNVWRNKPSKVGFHEAQCRAETTTAFIVPMRTRKNCVARSAFALAALLFARTAHCQDNDNCCTRFIPGIETRSAIEATVKEMPSTADRITQNKKDEARAVRRNLGIILGTSLAVGYYGKTHWWQEGFNRRLRTENEGWFGKNTYSGGADKLGHFFMNYATARLASDAFEWAGNSPEQSRRLAAWTTIGTYTAVEILDGFSKQWRFSREDAIINLVGAGTGYLLERHPGVDRVLDIRMHYRPSEKESFNPFGDYSGQTYLLVAKANGIPALRLRPLMRYLEFSIGYGTRGFSESLESVGMGKRYLYAGVSLNIAEVMNNTVFRSRTPVSRTQRISNGFLEYVQLPGTIAMARKGLDP